MLKNPITFLFIFFFLDFFLFLDVLGLVGCSDCSSNFSFVLSFVFGFFFVFSFFTFYFFLLAFVFYSFSSELFTPSTISLLKLNISSSSISKSCCFVLSSKCFPIFFLFSAFHPFATPLLFHRYISEH